jgi:hypothetical protein
MVIGQDLRRHVRTPEFAGAKQSFESTHVSDATQDVYHTAVGRQIEGLRRGLTACENFPSNLRRLREPGMRLPVMVLAPILVGKRVSGVGAEQG